MFLFWLLLIFEEKHLRLRRYLNERTENTIRSSELWKSNIWAIQSILPPWTLHQSHSKVLKINPNTRQTLITTLKQPKKQFSSTLYILLRHIVQFHKPIRRHSEAPFFWRRVWFGVWRLDHLSHPTHEWPFGFCSFSNLTEKDCQNLKAPDTPVSRNIYISINQRSLRLLSQKVDFLRDLWPEEHVCLKVEIRKTCFDLSTDGFEVKRVQASIPHGNIMALLIPEGNLGISLSQHRSDVTIRPFILTFTSHATLMAWLKHDRIWC